MDAKTPRRLLRNDLDQFRLRTFLEDLGSDELQVIDTPTKLSKVADLLHGNRKAVEAFVAFLFTPEAQNIFAQYGLRSVDPAVAKATAAQFPAVEDLFPIGYFNGWGEATPKYFGDDGIYTKAIAEVQQ